MKRTLAFTLALATVLATTSDLASAQGRSPRGQGRGGQESSGRATSRDGGRQNSGSSDSGSRTTGRASGPTEKRDGGSATSVQSGSSSGSSDSGNQTARRRGDGSGQTGAPVVRGDGGSDRVASRDRDAGSQPGRGRAVERRPGSGPSTIVVNTPGYWGGFYPWGYGGLGLGGYYGGLYDPWWYDDPPAYGGGYADRGYGYEGSLRLKMKPREAAVYVDGFYAGIVDDYDGVFQKLDLEAGPHRIEVRDDGFEPLMFEVLIQPGRKTTYTGELQEER